ncbi:MAG TPA: P1 family peptidase [Hyphomicrobiaceae bacterium]|nr:P1 family peptidase [Hyphomicrobiaceae bacterium]
MENLITDVAGLRVGNAHDAVLMSGVTVLVCDEPAVASAAVLGGAPAGRDLGCLEPEATVERIDAIVLSGGSGFGLDAASGVQSWLREKGRGFPVGTSRVPIVPQAICFDLLNGGNKDWGRFPPYRELAYAACDGAKAGRFALGTIGGGYGASTVTYKGGLGSASAITPCGFVVGALAIVNALGSAVIGEGPHFWAAPFEEGEEFGGLGMPAPITPDMRRHRWKGGGMPATTIACVATDAVLDKAATKRIALMAHCGLARALRLAHAPADGDTVFAVATGRRPLGDTLNDVTEIGATAADCLARSIARGVYEATTPGPGWLGPPAYRDRFPRTR